MRLLMLLMCSAALVFAAGCGDDDDGGSGGGGTSGLAGTVTHFLYEGSPVAGVAVGSPNGAADASDADGNFNLPGVAAPYDIVAAVPLTSGSSGTTIFSAVVNGTGPAQLGAVPVGFNNPTPGDPVLGRASAAAQAGYDQDGGTVEGTISGIDAAGETVRVAITDGDRSVSTTASAVSGDYGPRQYTWLRAPEYTVDVGALQEDGSGSFRYGRTQGITLTRGGSSMANAAVNPLPGTNGSISVAISPPAGFTISNVGWGAFAIIDGMSFPVDDINTDTGSLTIPPAAANISIVVVVEASLDDGGFAGGFQASYPGVLDGETLNIVIPAPPEITSPTDAATDVSLMPEIEFTGSPGSVSTIFEMIGSDVYGDLGQDWLILTPDTTGPMAIPVSPSVNAEMFPASNYTLYPLSVIEESGLNSGNLLVSVQGIFDPGFDISISLAGPRAFMSGVSVDFTVIDE